MSIRHDSKNEYSWKDIQEAQKEGFQECKEKVLKILHDNCNYESFGLSITKRLVIQSSVIKEIEKL